MLIWKALFGCSVGLMAFTLGWAGPRAWTVTGASPQKVTKKIGNQSGSHTTSRGPRYVFVSYYGGK